MHIKKSFLVVSAVVIGFMLSGGARAHALVSSSYKLASDGFRSTDPQHISGIRLYYADGSHPLAITDFTCSDTFPDWTPSGTQIVFTRQCVQTSTLSRQIMIMDNDGANTTALTDGTHGDESPHVNPQGTKIVFRRHSTSTHDDIYTMNMDGSNLFNVTASLPTSSTYTDPRWSPDGSYIVFAGGQVYSAATTTAQIYAILPNGTGLVSVTSGGLWADADPAVNPSGTAVVYERMPVDFMQEIASGTYSLWQIRRHELSSGTEFILASGYGYAMSSWKPDGTKITFTGFNSLYPGRNILIMDPFGANFTALTNVTDFLHNYTSWRK